MIRNIAAYKFVPIDDPPSVATQVQAWAEAGELLGSVLVAPEGINLFLAGERTGIDGFLESLRADPRFADVVAKTSDSGSRPFARLKVKVKPEIIAFRMPGAAPVDRPRAAAVAPATLQRWIAQGHDDDRRRLVLLDTRNREETAYGTFRDALVLPIDNFTELPAALAPHRDALRDATVVSFCTGGIRCEKAALWMNDAGMDNVLQLDGGILGYFEAVGGDGYEGRCFVFDARIALDPSLAPLAAPGTTIDGAPGPRGGAP